MPHVFGSHTLSTGGLDMAVRRAHAAGLDTLQLFTLPPKFYHDRSSISAGRVAAFRAAMEEVGWDPGDAMVHAPYLAGGATADSVKWERSAGALAKELERSTALGVGGVCFHPGSAGRSSPDEAAERTARAIVRALQSVDAENADGETRLWVENTAGAGTTFGRTPEEIGRILEHVPDALRPRTGYGLDTCHLFSSGLDISRSPEALAGILDAFEEAAGEPPSFFHLNDSEGALGSNHDRHLLLGDGEIGLEPFRWLLADPRTEGVPLVLETRQAVRDVEPDDPSPDPNDVAMAELLRELVE